MKYWYQFVLVIVLIFTTTNVAHASSLKYFGYYNYDYPGATPTKNFDEIKSLGNTNVAFTDLWGTNTPGIAPFVGTNIQAIVPVDKIFFENGTTGKPNKLISNWPARLQQLKIDLSPYMNNIYGFYLSDEPIWNDISKADFITTSKAVSEAFPGKATIAVEAYPPIASGTIPIDYFQYVTDIGFDYYITILDTNSDVGWAKFLTLYSQFTPYMQGKKVWLIPDGYALNSEGALRLPDALERYYNFALTKNNVVGMLVYSYGTGYQYESQHYLMPQFGLYNQSIRARHIEIGKSIIANATPPTQLPVGNFDYASCETLSGWACDSADYNQAIGVYLYHDGPSGQGGVHFSTPVANISRETAVASLCGGKPGHGFSIPVPTALKDGRSHTIYAYAGAIDSSKTNPLLYSSPKTITCSATTIAGDFNGDGKVNAADYTRFVAGYGTKYTILDYAKLVANYGN